MKPGDTELKLFLVDLRHEMGSCTHQSKLLRRIGLPQPNVHLVGAAQDIFVVSRPSHTDDMLHTFGVVHLPEDCGKSH